MKEFIFGYREVIPDQTVSDPWREISINTGGTQGTLQDIKVAERANGFCYRDSTKHHTRNRFIYWRISHDVLELVEHSLDVNLAGNRIRYKFVDTPILDGVSIHETFDNIVVLVPTVCSIHRLIFPHPDKYHRHDHLGGLHPDLTAPSIFSEVTASEARDPSTFHFFTNSTAQLPFLADSTLTLGEEEAIFVLGYHSGEILLVRQAQNGKVESVELKNESIMPRFLSGIADILRHKDKDGDSTVSLLLHTFNLETFVITLSRNGHLKFWSCDKAECVAIVDITAETDALSRNNIQGGQNHMLRKALDSHDHDECYLCIFMSFASESRLHVFKPIFNGSQIQVVRLNSLHLSQNDLIDFSLSVDRIWSVWRGKDGECEVFTASLRSSGVWVPVILENVPDSTQPPNFDGETDPRQVYLQHIFQPGRFPLNIISKALNIYKRSAVINDVNLNLNNLRQTICTAVEEEIQAELKESVVNDEDYIECANYCWQRFYSCCVQYHVAGLKPLGLLLLPNSSGTVLLKKSMISFLRPMDVLEHLILENDYVVKEQISHHLLKAGDFDITDDVFNLFKVINYLDQQVSEVFAYTFDKELSLLNPPDSVMMSLLDKIEQEMDTEFTDHVAEMLLQCDDLYQAMHKILELLRVEHGLHFDDSSQIRTSVNQIFTSVLGVSMVTGCLRQQIHVRFTICRNLLLIASILMKRSELESNMLETIRSVCLPEIVVLTQANYVMVWLAGLPAMTHLPTETILQRLSSLKLTPVFNLRTNSMSSVSLFELFIGSTGGYEARKWFSRLRHNEDTLAHWHLSLLPYSNCLFHTIWPVSGNSILAEWLLSCGQHLWLQQYMRLLDGWCEWNSSTYQFLLAASFLTTGEHYKAQKLFETAPKGLFTDRFFERILAYPHENQIKAYITYYLKVIHLFELHKSLDCAISLADVALSVTTPDDPLTATLFSIKFKHHLALKNYQEAYDALNANPDLDRRKDNLRDFVKRLLDEKKVDVLLSFMYTGMEELFCEIVTTRARAADPTNIYYDFLYAYHIKKGPVFFRLAASVMYEQAFRLNQYNDVDCLEKQVKCLLAAKNALTLCESQYAYIVVPVEQGEKTTIMLPTLAGSNDEPKKIVLQKQVNIVNLEALNKELLFASSKLKLVRFNPRNFFEITNPHELVTLLTNACLFKTALSVAKTFSSTYRQIFEGLTKKCCSLTRECEPAAWKWLVENDVQDLPIGTQGPATAAWCLLEQCIQIYEEEKMSIIHKAVCRKIISMHMFIPQWLLSSYKKRNPSELFRLLYNSGRLEEATEVATDYMMAALGYGKEYFDFKHAMQATKPAFCLPVRAFIALINQLKLINENDPERPFLREHDHLSSVLETYLKTAQRTSNEMCHYRLSVAD